MSTLMTSTVPATSTQTSVSTDLRQHPTAALVTEPTTTEEQPPTAADLIRTVTTFLTAAGADQTTIDAARLAMARGTVFDVVLQIDDLDTGVHELMKSLDVVAHSVARHQSLQFHIAVAKQIEAERGTEATA